MPHLALVEHLELVVLRFTRSHFLSLSRWMATLPSVISNVPLFGNVLFLKIKGVAKAEDRQ